MMRFSIYFAALVGVAAVTSATAMPHGGFKGAELAAGATIKLDAARATALKARSGRITDQELEKEPGGSGLRYSFDISSHGKTFEVGIDAKMGAILENKAEGRNPD